MHQDFTFERFIPTPSSAAAYRLASAVAAGERDAPRVLLFHGPTGTGKTHLMHAIAQMTAARTPHARIRAVSAHELSGQLFVAVRRDSTAELRRAHADVDLLLIDDLHDLAAKEGTQAEIGRLLRAWVEAGARVLAASSISPRRLPQLASALRAMPQVHWVRLERATAPESRRLLVALLARQSVAVHPAFLNRVVRQSSGDVRRLIGAATQLGAMSRQPHAFKAPPWLTARPTAS